MILSFGNQATEDIFNGEDTRAARRIPSGVWPAACRKLDMLNAAYTLQDLKAPPGNRLEKLRGGLAAFYSIRINDQFRIIFRWSDGTAADVRITDYH